MGKVLHKLRHSLAIPQIALLSDGNAAHMRNHPDSSCSSEELGFRRFKIRQLGPPAWIAVSPGETSRHLPTTYWAGMLLFRVAGDLLSKGVVRQRVVRQVNLVQLRTFCSVIG